MEKDEMLEVLGRASEKGELALSLEEGFNLCLKKTTNGLSILKTTYSGETLLEKEVPELMKGYAESLHRSLGSGTGECFFLPFYMAVKHQEDFLERIAGYAIEEIKNSPRIKVSLSFYAEATARN